MAAVSYRERLPTPWWWWVLGPGVAVLAAAEVHGGADGFARAVLPYLVLPGLTVVALVLLSRGSVRVADGVLHVPGARAPVSAFGRPSVLDRRGARLALGRSDAFYVVRPWLPGAVMLPVVDATDPTSFWLVGSRRPGELAEAVLAARDHGPG